MSYTIMLKEAIEDDVVTDENPSWLANSYKTIPHYDTADIDKVDRAYERTFNLKLIYRNKEDKDDTIIGIEFPSKSAATMFLLRWS